MSYMMAKGSYLGDAGAHWHPDFMFYGSRCSGSGDFVCWIAERRQAEHFAEILIHSCCFGNADPVYDCGELIATN